MSSTETISPENRAERLTFADTSIAYEFHRNAQPESLPVVFLGGALQDFRSWKRSVDWLKPTTTVVAIDPPGMGASQFVPASHGVDFLTDGVVAVLDAVGCERVCIVGGSYGAIVAYRFAQRFPERVHRLCLGGFVGSLPDSWRLRFRAHLRMLSDGRTDEFADQVVSELICSRADQPVNRRRLVERVLRSQVARLTQADIEKYAANVLRLMVQTPLDIERPPITRTLLITGEFDAFTPPARMRQLAANFDNAVFTTIQQSDHLCMLEQFETVAELIPRFFRDQDFESLPGCNAFEYFTARREQD